MGWLRYSPVDLVFSAKVPKTITHNKKLGLESDVTSDLNHLLEQKMDLIVALRYWASCFSVEEARALQIFEL